ncbi:MAG: HD domain-containing phosphohydrolase, partial [Vicinamibacterales bacterium]
MRFEFVIRSGKDAGRSVALSTGETLTLGRLKACDVRVDDEGASRRHCTLHARDHALVVTDLQSANGTFVNDRRVATAELAPGDRLRLGATVFELVAATGAEAAAGGRSSGALRLVPDAEGKTEVRKAIDPTRLEFLSAVFKRRDDAALLESAQRYLSTVHSVSDLLSRAISVEALFDSILAAILEVTGGDRAAILMRDGEAGGTGDVRVAAVRSAAPAPAAGDMVVSRTVVNDVLERGLSTFTPDAMADERYGAGASVVGQRIRSVMCAPMRTTDAILGVLYVDSHAVREFSPTTLELLAAIGNQAGVALHRARLVADMERLFLDVMKAIAATIDAKDGYTHRHSERVAAFALRLADRLGFSADERAVVELSGLLHDVGKIGVPDAILNKPGKLTDSEFAEMRRHPVHGARILGNIQSQRVADLLPGVKYHHERWDGTGYPDRLQGEAIPLLGRVLAVADFLDALTSDRAYRQALSLDEVVGKIQEQSGKAFDPRVVEAAVDLHA